MKTVVNKSNTAIIIKFNKKINDKNLTENNKNNLRKVNKKKTQNKRFYYLIPFLEMSVK